MTAWWFVAFGVTWLVGGNLVIARHYRRRGQSLWWGLRLGVFPFSDFTSREWAELLAVGAVAFTFLALGFRT
jgi:hypothetical protein